MPYGGLDANHQLHVNDIKSILKLKKNLNIFLNAFLSLGSISKWILNYLHIRRIAHKHCWLLIMPHKNKFNYFIIFYIENVFFSYIFMYVRPEVSV